MVQNTNDMTGRFAPSPSGRMHLGNIWSALLNWLAIRKAGGTLLLRVEDIDTARCRPEHTSRLLEDLRMLGLHWDEDICRSPIRQQERYALYQECLGFFSSKGLLYPCHCSRADLHAASAPHAENGHFVYDGSCRHEAGRLLRAENNPGNPPALRLCVPHPTKAEDVFHDELLGLQHMNLSTEWGDFVVRRSDGQYSYQLVCAVDDALTGINFVLRGADLCPSTFPQRYIMQLLGWPSPRYCHVPLLLDPDNRRLSKRQKTLDLGEMMKAGISIEDILGGLAFLAGWTDKPEAVTALELLAGFSISHIPACASISVPKNLFSGRRGC